MGTPHPWKQKSYSNFSRGLLFSATLPAQLVSFSRAGIKEPAFVRLDVETSLSDVVGVQMERRGRLENHTSGDLFKSHILDTVINKQLKEKIY